jgi:diguanylate cyclase (GGDEF)-like protein
MERFEEERNRALIHKTQLSFLMIDVDFFKNFNDQHGHLTGDQILREIATIVKGHIREIDIIGRYGGEEFCVVLPDTDAAGAGYVAERIRAAVESATIKAYDTTTKATLSIGISVYPQDGKKINELIDKADWALYRAKKEGRNRVCTFGVYNK